MIETIEQLKGECLKHKFITISFIAEKMTDCKTLNVNTNLIIEILDKIQRLESSQIKVEVNQEKIEELINSAVEPLSETVSSIEGIMTTMDKKFHNTESE